MRRRYIVPYLYSMDLKHVLNRGVDKRIIFLDNQDRLRFMHDLFEFNDEANVMNNYYAFQKYNAFARHYIEHTNAQKRIPRKLLVDVHAFCLMPNHYHLLLSERSEKGISRFMKKLNMGYALYFNKKYERNGALFQGRYKSVPITTNAHFIHMPYYIHLNPLDLEYPEWRKRELSSVTKAMDFLKTYRWSSHLDYAGIKNFPSVTQREFLTDYFGGHKKYTDAIKEWLKNMELETMKPLLLE